MVRIELTRREVTTVLQALAAQPYRDVAALIRRIVEQSSCTGSRLWQ